MSLKGRVALITGGARGIGAGIVEMFAKEGADLFFTYLSNEEAALKVLEIAKSYGVRAFCVQNDVSNLSGHKDLVNKVVAEFGRIDVLVNNAAYISIKQYDDIDEEEWDKAVNTNTKGPFFLLKAVVPHMPSGGAVINLSSSGTKTQQQYPAYICSKLGLEGITVSTAKTLAAKGITINTVSPGFTECDLLTFAGEKWLNIAKEASPLKRIGKPSDIANLIVFLANPEKGGWIVGKNIGSDGGLVINN